ncbi:GPW/gp25 family protein [Gottschalkia purinilytica]|nr:hypothetical protein [Gottschalkia purinilytica]
MYTLYSNQSINWKAKGTERILQNVSNLLNTFMYEVAYDRIMGRNTDYIDKPMSEQIPLVISETYELIEEYEPRVTVQRVSVLTDNEDPIIKVVVDID